MQDRFLSEVNTQYQKQLPFVVYRKPNDNRVKALLQNDTELYKVEDYTEQGFVFAPFNVEVEATVLIPFNNSKLIETTSVSKTEKTLKSEKIITSETEKSVHINLVNQGITAIENNSFKKVVLSRNVEVNVLETEPISIFSKLLKYYPKAFVYCWFHPKIGLWLGATPETLLQLSGKRLTTMALAGTQVYNDSIDVSWKPKELLEQQFVTDFIIKNLQPFSDSVKTSDVKTIKAGQLLHLKTDISCVLNSQNSDFKSIINALHPTPAVCGLPKNNAKQFILQHENYNREYYTGFLGEFNIKETKTRNTNRRNVENNAYQSVKTVSNLFVNLRCMQIKDNIANIYVGGGITVDSVAEHEWNETVNKTKTMAKVL